MSVAPFTGRLVPRFPSCPPPPGQTAAATDAPPPASVAAPSHSCPPQPRPGQDETAPGFGHTLAGAVFTLSSDAQDLADLPEFERAPINRFARGGK